MGWPAPPSPSALRCRTDPEGEERTMAIAVLGIDLGKNSCSVAGLDGTGRVVLRRRLTRESVLRLAGTLPACVVAMEACCGAHHLGRVLREQGHEVRLTSPEYVQPYVKAQKNDERDAEAIAEASTRPTMRFVELKSEAQLDAQILHRARSRLVSQRTALINQLRAVLLERGIVVAKGRRRLEEYLIGLLDEEGGRPAMLSPRTRVLIEDMRLNGPSSTGASGHSRPSSCHEPGRIRQRDASPPFRALALLTLPRSLLPSARARPSAEPGTSPHGWGSCHGRRRPGVSLVSSASPSEATPTCERS